MTGWNWCVASVETAGTYKFQSLVKGEVVFLDIVAKTLEVAKGSMAFVAMIYIFSNTEFLQREHTADTKKYFLLQTILPVTTIECVGNRLVELRVHVVVCIKQIKRNTTNIYSPNIGMNLIVHVRYIDNKWIAVLVKLALDGKGIEVLCLIISYLLTVHTQALSKVAKTIKKTNGAHINVRIRSFLQIVASEHSKTTRINLQHLVQTKFHTEVGNRSTLAVGFHIHIFAEKLVNVLHVLHDFLIFHNLFLAIVTQAFEKKHRIMVNFFVQIFVKTSPKLTGLVIPRPPHVVGKFVKTLQVFW